MIYDPLLDELAALPLELLVTPCDTQTEDGQTACWCPFCKSSHATPHFIIYRRKKGGMYGKPVEYWRCTQTGRAGWGAIELYAAIHGLGYWWRRSPQSPQTLVCVGDDLRQACLQLAQKAGHSLEELQASDQWRTLTVRDYRTIAARPQDKLTYEPKTGFTPQELLALGCVPWLDSDNVEHYSFESPNKNSKWKFDPSEIQSNFNIYSLRKLTLPAVSRKGEPTSEEIYSSPWNPIFVALVDDKTEDRGCIFFPGLGISPMVFSNNGEDTPAKISRWLTLVSPQAARGSSIHRHSRAAMHL